VRPLLAVRDVGALFMVLKQAGLTQRDIARLTGQSQSEVSEILAGRQVVAYDVLVLIAEGVGVPRELMGLSYGAYAGDVTVADPLEGVSAEMLRRHLIALGGIAPFGASAAGLGGAAGSAARPGAGAAAVPAECAPRGEGQGPDPPAQRSRFHLQIGSGDEQCGGRVGE